MKEFQKRFELNKYHEREGTIPYFIFITDFMAQGNSKFRLFYSKAETIKADLLFFLDKFLSANSNVRFIKNFINNLFIIAANKQKDYHMYKEREINKYNMIVWSIIECLERQ